MSILKLLRNATQKTTSRGQIEILRMTHQGGWKTHEPFPDEDEDLSVEEWERPQSDEDWPVLGIPGKYRLVRRVDGRIRETIWQYETQNAERYYERERQRELLKEMDFAEVKDEYLNGPGRLDRLDSSEIGDRYHELREAQ